MQNEADFMHVVDGEGNPQRVVADIVVTPSPSSSSGAAVNTYRPRGSRYGIPGYVLDPQSGQAIVVQRAVIDAALAGPNVLVQKVGTKHVMVLALLLQVAAEVDIYFQTGGDVGSESSSSAQDTAICFSPTTPLKLDRAGINSVLGGFMLPPSDMGHFQSRSGEALVLHLSAAVGVSGCVSYALLEPTA